MIAAAEKCIEENGLSAIKIWLMFSVKQKENIEKKKKLNEEANSIKLS